MGEETKESRVMIVVSPKYSFRNETKTDVRVVQSTTCTHKFYSSLTSGFGSGRNGSDELSVIFRKYRMLLSADERNNEKEESKKWSIFSISANLT